MDAVQADGNTLFVVGEGVNPQGGKELVVSRCPLGDIGCSGVERDVEGKVINCARAHHSDETLLVARCRERLGIA